MIADEDKIGIEQRKIRFDLQMVDWDVFKYGQQVEMSQKQLDDSDKQIETIRNQAK
jgi:hypothetical protein